MWNWKPAFWENAEQRCYFLPFFSDFAQTTLGQLSHSSFPHSRSDPTRNRISSNIKHQFKYTAPSERYKAGEEKAAAEATNYTAKNMDPVFMRVFLAIMNEEKNYNFYKASLNKMFFFLEIPAILQCLMPPSLDIWVLHISTCIYSTHNTGIDPSDCTGLLYNLLRQAQKHAWLQTKLWRLNNWPLSLG